ncbi:hypothetical protein CMV_006723 [Castanea mollissima]|uniref:Uncharacterized protein n=1 Tax=Castanea mollissima TaxID=60419 RepID=A0A8J4RGI8_9ROSI|nr:hypothetical protein CMV_006723 [Castanea mollissima]
MLSYLFYDACFSEPDPLYAVCKVNFTTCKCHRRVGQTHSRRAVNKTIVKEDGKIVAKDWSHLLHKNGCPNPNQIESALPSLARPIMSLDANEDAVVGALKQSLRQSETLGAQRAGLEDMFKEMKRKAQNDDFSAIFNLEDYKASREKCYKHIQAAIAKF